MVLRNITHPYEPLLSDKHPTWRSCFLLVLASAKELVSCMASPIVFGIQEDESLALFFLFFFPHDFVAKTQNPSVLDPESEKFTIPSLEDFVDGDEASSCCVL